MGLTAGEEAEQRARDRRAVEAAARTTADAMDRQTATFDRLTKIVADFHERLKRLEEAVPPPLSEDRG